MKEAFFGNISVLLISEQTERLYRQASTDSNIVSTKRPLQASFL